MAQSTFGRRTIKIVRRGAIAIICLHAGLGVAQEMESLSLSDGVSGHARPVSPSRIPPAGSGPEHQVIPVLPHPFGGNPAQKDTVLQTTQTNQTTLSGKGFNGIGISSGYAVQYIPPDTSGAAGDTQYVQFVNAVYAVFDKNGNFCDVNGCSPANSRLFYRMSSLFKAAPNFPQTNPCASRDDGDVVALFDRLAHRWILSQFAVPSGGPYYHCVAVSQTNDATGGYYVYAFPQPYFPDYPKISTWPDGYYATFNMFRGNRFVGASVCAYERAQMLVGGTAHQLCATSSPSFGSILPADLDGKSMDLNPDYTSTPTQVTCRA